MDIRSNIERVTGRIAGAAGRAGRDPAGIKLCVVTKMVSVEQIKEAVSCGIEIIGESRVHEALQKQPQIGRGIEWHMIGHLQSRKAGQAAEVFDMVQSIDSISTAAALEKRLSEIERPMRILIEVNTSAEEQKNGVAPDRAERLIRDLLPMEHLRIEGLMTMAAFVSDPEMARPSFSRLRALADRLNECPLAGARFDVLSMGMSNDFEVAVEEGSTMVRIGTAIFEV